MWQPQNKVKLFMMKPAGFRFAETYYLSPSLPFNPLSYLVRFGSKADVNQRQYYLPYISSAKRYSINFKIKLKSSLEMSPL